MIFRMTRRVLACMGLGVFALWSGAAVAGQVEALTAHVPDRVDFDAAKNAGVKKIAILHINPMRHFVIQNSGLLTAAFPGLAEALVEGGVNTKHTSDYLDELKKKSVAFGPQLADALQRELTKDGYEVSVLQQSPHLKEDKKTLDYSNIRSDADALLTVWYSKTGYWSPTNKPDFSPMIVVGVKLTDAHTFETLFFKAFDVTPVASQVSNENVEAMVPDAKYQYADFDALMSRFDESVQGLQDSQDLIAVHVAQRLRPAAANP